MVRPIPSMGSEDARTHHGASEQFISNQVIKFSFLDNRGLAVSGYSARLFCKSARGCPSRSKRGRAVRAAGGVTAVP